MSATATEFTPDFSFGLRQMRKNLSLTLLCAVVLGIGIGATTLSPHGLLSRKPRA